MGSITSRIRDDIEEYATLCGKYGEDIRYSTSGVDCYGEHSRGLLFRFHVEESMSLGKTRAEAEKQWEHLSPRKIKKTAWSVLLEDDS